MLTDDIFHPVTLADREWIVEALDADPQEAAVYSFATNYVWGNGAFTAAVARIGDCCVYRWTEDDGTHYHTFPFGRGDKASALRTLRAIAEKDGVFNVIEMSEQQARLLQSVFPGEFLLSYDRDMADYLYVASDLATLPGSRYQPKRNHVRRFKAGGDWSFEAISEGNIPDCRVLFGEWLSERKADGSEDVDTISHETAAINLALDRFVESGLVGGILRRGARPVAFAIGERLSDETAVVHFEKALPSVEGAFQTVNQEFAAHLASLGFKYINREEDMGLGNLRKAKLSYHPLRLVRKYHAALSDVVSASLADRPGVESLWIDVFGDTPEYVRLFIDAHFDPDSFLIVRRDGEIAAMCALLKTEFVAGGAPASARYVYALATARKWRGRGLATRIIDKALEISGTPLILLPENDELRSFYVRLGFADAFTREEWVVERDDDAARASFRPADARLLVRRREYAMAGDYVKWDEDAVSFAISLCVFLGGGAVETDQGETILYHPTDAESIRVLETSVPSSRRPAVFSALLARHGARRAFYRTRGGMVRYPDGYDGPYIEDGRLDLALD